MLDFNTIQSQYYNEFLDKYCCAKNITKDHCSTDIQNECLRAAEAKTYVHLVIPEEFHHFTIFDVHGKNASGEDILSVELALKAKNCVCNYCWGKTWQQLKTEYIDNKHIKKYLQKNSCMPDRRITGANMMIWGDSHGSLGRTMLASIIMKEAIRLRIINNNRDHEYAWINWAALRSNIIQNTDEMVNYSSCDWLVIDDIEDCRLYGEERANRNIGVLEPFFFNRLKKNLPTIFVFKFSLSNMKNISNFLGTTISSIYNRSSTFKISLGK